MRHYIIDVHNVLHQHPEWKQLLRRSMLLEARQTFVSAITRFADRYPAFFFTLVFDGLNTGVIAPYRNIAIFETPRGTPADIIIKQQIDRDPQPRQCIVISSDTEVHNYARLSGCIVWSSAVFLQELKNFETKQGQNISSGNEKPVQSSTSELEELRRLFETPEKR